MNGPRESVFALSRINGLFIINEEAMTAPLPTDVDCGNNVIGRD
jgi:hypothetical protein